MEDLRGEKLAELTQQHFDEFELLGVTRLERAISETAVAEMLDALWSFLHHAYGLERKVPSSWIVERPTGMQALTRKNVFSRVCGAPVTAALDRLLGSGRWRTPNHWGAPLLTFPSTADWRLTTEQWHLDFECKDADRLPGVRVLALLSDTSAQGGTTLVASGSHRLIMALQRRGELHGPKSSDIRRSLTERYEWFRRLCTKDVPAAERMRILAETTSVDDTELRVLPLHGKPGDVYLMHPWSLHAPSANCTPVPRVMISESVFVKSH